MEGTRPRPGCPLPSRIAAVTSTSHLCLAPLALPLDFELLSPVSPDASPARGHGSSCGRRLDESLGIACSLGHLACACDLRVPGRPGLSHHVPAVPGKCPCPGALSELRIPVQSLQPPWLLCLSSDHTGSLAGELCCAACLVWGSLTWHKDEQLGTQLLAQACWRRDKHPAVRWAGAGAVGTERPLDCEFRLVAYGGFRFSGTMAAGPEVDSGVSYPKPPQERSRRVCPEPSLLAPVLFLGPSVPLGAEDVEVRLLLSTEFPFLGKRVDNSTPRESRRDGSPERPGPEEDSAGSGSLVLRGGLARTSRRTCPATKALVPQLLKHCTQDLHAARCEASTDTTALPVSRRRRAPAAQCQGLHPCSVKDRPSAPSSPTQSHRMFFLCSVKGKETFFKKQNVDE
ncbi:hypothetical protein H920_09076 [Fukomys damarensis]|uniref:Uncharacterized protein n=1 Tax=Fukomys damarensis TaxID=885580 RepID=A0A091DBF4_FUKDA|nr:hypothetical protein H920_09076 [Fukomys damarensis]